MKRLNKIVDKYYFTRYSLKILNTTHSSLHMPKVNPLIGAYISITRQAHGKSNFQQTAKFFQKPFCFFSTGVESNILPFESIGKPLEALQQLRALQGKIIILEKTAEQLQQFQLDFINKALAVGFNQFNNKFIGLNKYYDRKIFDKWLVEFFKYFTSVNRGYFLDKPEEFYMEQSKLYKFIHHEKFFDEEKLFLEFLLGVARFDIGAQVINKFHEYLLKANKLKMYFPQNTINKSVVYSYIDKHNFFSRLQSSVKSVEILHKEIGHAFEQNLEEYWVYAADFFNKNKEIDRLAMHLASMHYIPPNKQFITIAQVLHWNGFGSNGDFFDKFLAMRCMKTQALYYHAEMTSLTKKRINIIQIEIKKLTETFTNIMASVLTKQFSEEKYYVKDVCSGPDYAAVQLLFEKMPNKIFQLYVSEIDGTSILSLLKKMKKKNNDRLLSNVNLQEVRYEDFNFPLQVHSSDRNKFHVVSARLCLHQLAKEDIYRAYRYFASIIKIGGIIVNSDVTSQRHFQVILIPANFIDREGHVLESKRMDLLQLAIPGSNSKNIKLAYPLHKLQQKFPIYVINIFTVIEIPNELIKPLALLWSKGSYEECNKLVSNVGNKLPIEQDLIIELAKQQMSLPRRYVKS